MEDLNLQKIIADFPDCVTNGAKLKGLISDLYPDTPKAIVNSLVFMVNSGIAKEIRDTKGADEADKSRWKQKIEDDGFAEKFATLATEMFLAAVVHSGGKDSMQALNDVKSLDLLPVLTENKIYSLLTHRYTYQKDITYNKAANYADIGRIFDVRCNREGSVFTAKSKGSYSNIYSCCLKFTDKKLSGFSCDCPSYTNWHTLCKHLVGLMILIERKRQELLKEKKADKAQSIAQPVGDKESSSKKSLFETALFDFDIENGVLKKYNGKEQNVVIPGCVTSIGGCAFYGCNLLKSVTIPNGVTSIGAAAFYACQSLTSITIPNSVTSIGVTAFYACRSLTSITIPNSVTVIGASAFRDCDLLASITIPDGIKSIGGYAFDGCATLKEIIFKGTTTQWNAVLKGFGIPLSKVSCAFEPEKAENAGTNVEQRRADNSLDSRKQEKSAAVQANAPNTQPQPQYEPKPTENHAISDNKNRELNGRRLSWIIWGIIAILMGLYTILNCNLGGVTCFFIICWYIYTFVQAIYKKNEHGKSRIIWSIITIFLWGYVFFRGLANDDSSEIACAFTAVWFMYTFFQVIYGGLRD